MKIMILTVTAALLVLAGCRIVDSGERGFSPVAESAQMHLQRDTEKLGTGILTAFRQEDFNALIKNTPGELAKQVTENPSE